MMRTAVGVTFIVALATLPANAFEFLGVELCQGSIDTRIELPPGSELVLESVEIGDHGGLVMLLSARSGKVMQHVDDLMTGITGQRGSGDDDSLEWTDGRLTGVAQRVAKKYAALAVASADPCPGSVPQAVPAETAPTADPGPVATAAPPQGAPAVDAPPTSAVPAAAAAAATTAPSVSNPAPGSETAPAPAAPVPDPIAAPAPDFEIVGAISHQAADRTWVDVMGLVANHTDTGYRLATFDVSLYRTDGSLICVDTISVSVLKAGQERAFRDAIRCPGYEHDAVAELRLQFAGGF